jgi:ankyrin repeat protein/formylglycine-generating enzyme required for sulfatase activity
LLSKGANINAKNKEEESPLHSADYGNREVVELLIAKGANVNAMDKYGQTPLHAAASRGYKVIVALLIDKGANVKAKDKDGRSPLHGAAVSSGKEMLELLLEKGADINDKDNYGLTPLDYASNHLSLDVESIALLISKGADIGADVNARNDKGLTPIVYPILGGAKDVVALMIAKGADVNAKEGGLGVGREETLTSTPLMYAAANGKKEIAELLISKGADVNASDHGETILHISAKEGLSEIVELLISKGADVNAQDPVGMGPLYYTVWNSKDDYIEQHINRMKTIALLINKGANVNAKSKDGLTPLMASVFHGPSEIAEFLISKGADLNAKAIDGATALTMAIQNRRYKVTELLISKGADVNIKDLDGTTPLLATVQEAPKDDRGEQGFWNANEMLDVVKMLISKGADVKAKDKNGNSLFHEILKQGREIERYSEEEQRNYIELVKLLISKGADVNERFAEGGNPLFTAIHYGNIEVATQLIAKGADVKAKDENGMTALQFIFDYPYPRKEKNQYTEFAKQLFSNGAYVNEKFSKGETPLFWAIKHENIGAATLLIAKGSDVNAINDVGDTPLIKAARDENFEAAALLMDSGADISIKNRDGYTALDAAYSEKLRNLLVSKQEPKAWESANKISTLQSYTDYLKLNTEGQHAALALSNIQKLISKTAPPSTEATKSGKVFKDCPDCPEMINISQGVFIMGSPASETGRFKNEGATHLEYIEQPFSLGKTAITRGQFAAFVNATNYDAGNKCWVFEGVKPQERDGANWRNPGYSQDDSHPVSCINWNDAKAYADWLSIKTGKHYRLPSDAEWEYAARAGTTTSRYWGDSPDQACNYANVADQTLKSQIAGITWDVHSCNDGYAYTSPVAIFKPNAFGFYDMQGNVNQWTADNYDAENNRIPDDSPNMQQHMLRGGSWLGRPQTIRLGYRSKVPSAYRMNTFGFRVARELP